MPEVRGSRTKSIDQQPGLMPMRPDICLVLAPILANVASEEIDRSRLIKCRAAEIGRRASSSAGNAEIKIGRLYKIEEWIAAAIDPPRQDGP